MKVVHEGERGCGFRKPKGLYLRSDGLSFQCGLLPITLEVCPCCGSGIKQARGFTWITREILGDDPCKRDKCPKCGIFGLDKNEKIGLIWIGEQHYASPQDFIREAKDMGISRRISRVPRGFEIGETWICLAHPKCGVYQDEHGAVITDEDGNPKYKKQIFYAFKPDRIEYVVAGDESEEEIERLEKRGITPVIVKN